MSVILAPRGVSPKRAKSFDVTPVFKELVREYGKLGGGTGRSSLSKGFRLTEPRPRHHSLYMPSDSTYLGIERTDVSHSHFLAVILFLGDSIPSSPLWP